MSNAPKGPAEVPDLGPLSELAPQLAQTFVSIASDIALVIGDDGVIRNAALGGDLPGSAADWVGRSWSDTVTGETRRKVELLLSEAQSSGVTRRREVSHPTAEGHELAFAYAAIRLGRNGPVLAVGRDLRAVSAIQQHFIDTQQSMERDYWRQRQAESRYRTLFQVATDAVMVVDAETLTIVEANRACAALFGRRVESLPGQPATVGIAPAARPAVDELLAVARSSGRPGEMRTLGAAPAAGTARAPLLDVSATPLRSEDTMLLLVRLRAVEADGDSSSLRLADFVERTPDAVVITDSAGHVLMANPAFVALARASQPGAAANDMPTVGRALAELLRDPQQRLPAVLLEARRRGIAEQRRVLVGGGGGEAFDVEVSAALLTEGDQECLGLTLRRVEHRLAALPPQVNELASAIDRLAAQVGLVALPELLQETADLAERHLIEAALARAHGDRLQAAQLLGLAPENLWARLRHHGFDADGPGRRHTPPGLLN